GADGLMSASDKSKLDGVAASANNYSHPANHPATVITEDSTHRFVTGTEKGTWNAKLDKAGGTVTGDLTVSGDLTINGTTTSIDTVNLEIEDNIVLLNKNQTGTPPTTLRSGIEVERGDSDNVKIQFNELTDKWEITEDGSTFHDIAKEDDSRFLTSGQKTAATRDATGSQNGLMTATQATKLNSIATNANNYSLPTATGSTKGGVKVGSSLSISSEVLDVPASATDQKGVIKFPQTEYFSGDGVTTEFVLTNTPAGYLAVYLGGLRQTPTDDYSVSNKTITFLSAPNSSQKVVVDYIAV
ncbi:MAG: head fiber protein, partial [Candidatus Electryoneaceae bacterium]|nr:head fiber protein [Candidatus Electryoneaceae bacterium]